MESMEAVILAAGYSSRANDFKMTSKLGIMTVLEHTVSKFDGICQKVIIVSGFQGERLKEVTIEMQNHNYYDMEIVCVFNPRFNQGMFSSVQRGCREVSASHFFITPGDCPLVEKETIQNLVKENGNIVIPSYQMKGGHPIKLTVEIKKRILEANADSNLRYILQGYEKNFLNVKDPGVLMDLDTPEDFNKAIEYYNERSRKR
ncbi:nucleotidyltransferase family protein [Bacillus sp. Marseille-P3661]|uniref:nucleotidyltransferase family protein n=1 Tax=Bacillus sp. Marseille-P3661 TaxID=1936234 RepID=UPI000C8492F9|nr:nucleotidyltransferase family protein [Bacillus sp. Marseille-P3661]